MRRHLLGRRIQGEITHQANLTTSGHASTGNTIAERLSGRKSRPETTLHMNHGHHTLLSLAAFTLAAGKTQVLDGVKVDQVLRESSSPVLVCR